ncbi:uncharacterized protein EKO05_0007857 [Ascochyta rabiei]|nr:uncharacterized protein EKO05_0007857 [Ascochyta rabiei]UPX17508.1 hypothetical protein EKO05_0007857 [Ascochyta rabiei]
MRSPSPMPSARSTLSHFHNATPTTMSPARNMPTVSSPLSPRTEPLAIPSGRRRPQVHSRQSSTSGPAMHLRLPSLPRFHPANFGTPSSSASGTPVTGPNSPNPPLSPRPGNTVSKYEAQKQMYLYQQQLQARTSTQVRGALSAKPTSPRLDPLASPGAVTPFELEGTDGYLTAGVSPQDAASHVERLIRNEASRRGDLSPGRTTSVGGR